MERKRLDAAVPRLYGNRDESRMEYRVEIFYDG
jgi:hypothetical protein